METISLHVGQCGIQVANSFWNLIIRQHQIKPDASSSQLQGQPISLFYQTPQHRFKPRSILIDTQPGVINQIATGQLKQLFSPKNFIKGKQSSADMYVRGHYQIGKQLIDIVLQRIRLMAQNCQSVKGLVMTHSINGGTGSGFGSLILQRLSVQYTKVPKINYSVIPSTNYNNIVTQPYNAILSMSDILEHTDLTVNFDNQALYKICESQLDIQQPKFSNVNSIIAQVLSSLTAGVRFQKQPYDYGQIINNLVTYPRIHNIIPSASPWIPQNSLKQILTASQITYEALKPGNQMITCLPYFDKKYITTCLIYRGFFSPKQIIQAARLNKKVRQYIDYVPTGMQVRMCTKSAINFAKKSVVNLANSYAFGSVIKNINRKFDKMYEKRAFVHWYVGIGLDQGFFGQARQNMADIYATEQQQIYMQEQLRYDSQSQIQ